MAPYVPGSCINHSQRLHWRLEAADIDVWLIRLDVVDQRRPWVKQWLAELTRTPIEALELATHAHGKPYLRHSDIRFSVSHSRHWLALAWTYASHDIGLDIEETGRQRAFQSLAERYFHPVEIAHWQAQPEAERESTWLQFWTRKEACLKAHGLGLRLRLSSLNCHENPIKQAQIGHWQWHTKQLKGPEQDLVLTLSWPTSADLKKALADAESDHEVPRK